MAKLNRQLVVAEALALLDEDGLDGVSTRRLAQRLGVEQPALYWHFRRKEDLLVAMAREAAAPVTEAPLPQPDDDWQRWFVENYRCFRRALLHHRDGARLHAGTFPTGDDLEALRVKLAFLVDHGIPAGVAQAAMMAAGQLTLGNALEAQASAADGPPPGLEAVDHEEGFEAGLRLLVEGLEQRRVAPALP